MESTNAQVSVTTARGPVSPATGKPIEAMQAVQQPKQTQAKELHLGFSPLTEEERIPARGNIRHYPLGTVLGNYFYVGDKPSGVEPGSLMVRIDERFVARFNADEGIQRILQGRQFTSVKELREYLQTELFYKRKIRDTQLKKIMDAFAKKLRDEGMAKIKPGQPALNLELLKQDFNDPKLINWVAPPTDRLSNTGAIKKLPKILRSPASKLYEMGRLTDPENENINAILECLANDIARAYGMPAQNQRLIFGTYINGFPKILTMCEWEPKLESLESSFAGSKDKSVYENYLIALHRDHNGKVKKLGGKPVPVITSSGHYQADTLDNLAETTALAYFLGDRDFWGSKLQNKGRVGNHLYCFDCGHAFRDTNYTVVTLQDNFAFFQPDSENQKFKNMSVFLDTSLSDRMMGMFYLYRMLGDAVKIDPKVKSRIETAIAAYETEKKGFKEKLADIKPGSAIEIFEEYEKKFRDLAVQKGEPKRKEQFALYANRVAKAKADALANADRMLRVFEERMQLTPLEVDLLDNVEKLTSQTSALSSDKKVILNHLAVMPESRIVWQIAKRGGKIVLYADVEAHRIDTAFAQLRDHLRVHDGAQEIKAIKHKAAIEIVVDANMPEQEQLKKLSAVFAEDNVRHVKHPEVSRIANFKLRIKQGTSQLADTMKRVFSPGANAHTQEVKAEKKKQDTAIVPNQSNSIAHSEDFHAESNIILTETELEGVINALNRYWTSTSSSKDSSFRLSANDSLYQLVLQVIKNFLNNPSLNYILQELTLLHDEVNKQLQQKGSENSISAKAAYERLAKVVEEALEKTVSIVDARSSPMLEINEVHEIISILKDELKPKLSGNNKSATQERYQQFLEMTKDCLKNPSSSNILRNLNNLHRANMSKSADGSSQPVVIDQNLAKVLDKAVERTLEMIAEKQHESVNAESRSSMRM